MRSDSLALARMGLRRLEDALPGVVKRQKWRLRPVLWELPGQTGDQTPEWRVDFKRFPESKVICIPAYAAVGRTATAGPSKGRRSAGPAGQR